MSYQYRDEVFGYLKDDVIEYIFSLDYETDPKKLPKSAGVYFCVNYDDEVLYIGKSINIYNRWGKHQHRDLIGDVKIYYQEYEDENDERILIDEAAFITILRPPLNQRIHIDL